MAAPLKPTMVRTLKRLLLAALLLTPCGAWAHEIGTTTIRLTLHSDRTWIALVTTAPQTLVNKLEEAAGEPRSSGLTAEALRAKLDSFRQTLARHIDVRFNGRPSPATVSIAQIEVLADAIRPDFVEVRATGSIPEGARSISWRYDLTLATYALLLADGDGAEPQTH